jgi:hypothetical protein
MTSKTPKVKGPILPVDIKLIKVLLGPPPVLRTENPHRYWELFEQFAAAIAPSSIVEWMWLKDIADLTWEIARLRRYRAMWIEFQRDWANLEMQHAREHADDADLFRDKGHLFPMTPDKIEERRSNWGPFDTEYHSAFLVHEELKSYEAFEKLLKSAELRRDRILRELDARRERVAPMLRKKSDEVIEASADDVPLSPE